MTYGPLLEFSVDGNPSGARIEMTRNSGTVDVTWELASVTVPMSRVELIVNGEIRESEEVDVAEALTILEQIEGAVAYLDTLGTRAVEKS